MKFLILTLLFVGFVFIVVGYINSHQKCSKPMIEYRYVPRSPAEDAEEPVSVTSIFANMFHEPSPWLRNLLPPPSLRNTQTSVNKFFLSDRWDDNVGTISQY